MTRDEKSALDLLIDTFHRFEERDDKWKQQTDVRLGQVEDYIVAKDALDRDRRERGLSARARVGLVMSGLFGLAGLVVALVK